MWCERLPGGLKNRPASWGWSKGSPFSDILVPVGESISSTEICVSKAKSRVRKEPSGSESLTRVRVCDARLQRAAF